MMTHSLSSLPSILSVDDDRLIHLLIERMLSDRCRLFIALNAEEALSQLLHQKIDLLLLDVSMPGISGLELCRIVRQLPHCEKIPIIMLTGRNSPFDRVQGCLAGATEYLTKPFQPNELCQIVDRYLGTSACHSTCVLDDRTSIANR
jgi:CheY-like chemotaxis protein